MWQCGAGWYGLAPHCHITNEWIYWKKVIRMQHWRPKATDGAKFWISCKRPAFLRTFSRLQMIQNKRPWTVVGRHMWKLDSYSKEEQSGGTVEWAQKLQTTHLVDCFDCWIPWNAIFILCSENSPNLPCYITSRVHIIESQCGVPPLGSSLVLHNRGD